MAGMACLIPSLPLPPATNFNPAHAWTVVLTTATCVAVVFFIAIRRFLRHDHVLEIPGPVKNASWLYGNFPELILTQPYGRFAFQWLEQYGSTYRFKGCFSEDLLFTSDPATVRYILNNGKLFDFPPSERFLALMLLGKNNLGALRSDGEVHRRVKNAFFPAFTSARLQLYVPVMKDIALKAADKLMQRYLEKSEQNDSNMTVDIFQLIQHISSDIIGEVGFSHKFNAVETDGGDEITQSHQGLVLLSAKRSKSAILGDGVVPYIPPIFLLAMLHLPTRMFRVLSRFRELSQAWSTGLLRDHLEDDSIGLGLVGFVVAEQETTTIAMLWALCELAKRPTWQDQIRKEIIEAQTTDLNLDKLEYLNCTHQGNATFSSECTPIASTERNSRIWGTDANTFDPLRWLDSRFDTENLSGIGPYSNLLFEELHLVEELVHVLVCNSVLEIQLVLVELISKFRFSFQPGQENEIIACYATTLLPLDVGSGKPSLPVVIEPILGT
ncbi:cytochrome P450 [Marasmius fiardii PR-910]|nr:cytochrome P450 [Marasmius fiardii PR-910]